MLTDTPVYLLRIVDNGKVVASAKLEIADEDNERAWELFEDAWSNLAMIASPSIFQVMRFATGRSAVPAGTTEITGLSIVSQRQPTDIIIPDFRKEMKLNGKR